MSDRDEIVKAYAEVRIAYDIVANIRERHHHNGGLGIDCKQLETLAHELYYWRQRLCKQVYPRSEVEDD